MIVQYFVQQFDIFMTRFHIWGSTRDSPSLLPMGCLWTQDFFRVYGLDAFWNFFLLGVFLTVFYVLIFWRIFVDLYIHLIVFKLYEVDLRIYKWTYDSSIFLLSIFRIVRNFQDMGCAGHEANSIPIRVFSHQFWVHLSKHL